MSAPQMTTAEALRAALASTITCSAQELEETIGKVVVATAAELPAMVNLGSGVRSVRDLQARTTVLLADRIPAGEEAKAAVAEIKLWHGLAVAQTVFGQAADELLAPANPRRFSISSSKNLDYRLYWHGHAWVASTPDHLYTAAEADAEVERLRGVLTHDKTIQRVDEEQHGAMSAVWNTTFYPALEKSGYGEIPTNERLSDAATALRSAAVSLADQAVREAGFADFKGWTEWAARLPETNADVDSKLLKNALGQVAAPPFYIWANEDCANMSDDFSEAKATRLLLINEGGESVYIVDADGVEVVDAEIEAHEALTAANYFAGPRNPDVKPEFPGAFMVNDPNDPDGFAIVGDDIGALILEARDHLLDLPAQVEVKAYEAYELPEAKALHNSWDACQGRGYQPSENQKLVISAVQSALDAGLYYTNDVRDHCAKVMAISSQQDSANFANARVEGGIFGMECYYARKYLEACSLHASEDKALAQLQPHVGQKLGTIVLNDGKRCTGAVVAEVDGASMWLQFKRGSSLMTCMAPVLSVKNAIDRAAEQKLRKDDFEQFTKQAPGNDSKSVAEDRDGPAMF